MNKLYNSDSRINTGKIVSSVLVCFMLIGLAIYGIYFNIKANQNKQMIQQQYQRTFTDMADYVNQAETYLLKAMAAGTPGTVSVMLERAAMCSSQAESCLAALPIDQHSTEKISNYLVQLSDIADCWSHRAIDAGKLTSKEYETLSSLYGYAQDLTGIVSALGEEITNNSYTWGKVGKKTLQRISDPFTDYPKLTYNGKFSAHMSNSEPKGLVGYDMDREDCRGKATKYFSTICSCPAEQINIEYCGENSRQNINTWCYKVTCPENISGHIDITKKGGHLYSMMISRDIGNVNLSPNQAIESGKSFLKSMGMKNMKECMYSIDEDTVTVTYAYEKNGVLYYPDSVKIKIALDNGTPVAYEGNMYIAAHHIDPNRVGKASISQEDAKALLSSHLKVESVRDVVVPDGHGGEYYAYEFKGRVSGHPVLVYVDAKSGTEADILLVYENENGVMSA